MTSVFARSYAATSQSLNDSIRLRSAADDSVLESAKTFRQGDEMGNNLSNLTTSPQAVPLMYRFCMAILDRTSPGSAFAPPSRRSRGRLSMVRALSSSTRLVYKSLASSPRRAPT
jgi:hypothetical protein